MIRSVATERWVSVESLGLHAELGRAAEAACDLPSGCIPELLWLINAPPALLALIPVCESMSGVLRALRDHVVDLAERDQVEIWINAVDWIARNRRTLMDSLGPAVDEGRGRNSHPLRRKGIGRHALYAAMWGHQSDPALRTEYQLLAGHFLLAHAAVMRAHIPPTHYHTYSGTRWPRKKDGGSAWGYPYSPELAGLELRRLTRSLRREHLAGLDLARPTAEVAAHAASPRIGASVRTVLRYIAISLGYMEPATSGGGGGGGAGLPVDPYRDDSADLRLFSLAEEDMVLADESLPVRLAMLPTKANAQSDSTDVQDVHEAPPEEKIPSPEECCSTLDQHPTEVLGDGYTLLVDVRPRGLASAGPQQLAQSQGRHLVRAGLALPWGTERLSPTEKYTFLDSTRRALQARLRRLASGGAGDVETAGLLALLVAFHTGADVREALDIRPAAQVGDAPGQMALERADDTNWWRKPVFAAPYMGRPVETGASPNCLRETVSSLYLPVGCGTARFLRAYWGASDSRVHAGLVPAAWRDAAVASAQAHLASLEGLARSITLSAIEHALFRDVLAETRRMDLAVHLAGRSVFHSGSTIYYAAPAVADLQNVYRSWCASLPCDEESQSDR